MKKIMRFIGLIIVVGVLAACGVMFGPDKPIGRARLVIKVGEGARSAVYDDVINALYYKVALTGPSGENVERRISPGVGQLVEPVTLGTWQIWAKAYTNEDVLAGSSGKDAVEVYVIEGANSVPIPITVHGGYFAVNIGSTPHGTVEINRGVVYHNDGTNKLPGAFPNAKIVLKVTPDSGYVLKEGSLTATAIPVEDSAPPQEPGGSNEAGNGTEPADTDDDEADDGPHITEGPLAIEGLDAPNVENGGIFSFIMPYAKVTLTAEFEILPSSITINSPTDENITVAWQNSSGADSSEISYANADTVTFMVSDSSYSLSKGNLKWYVQGEEIPAATFAAGSAVTIAARDYIVKPYSLTVTIEKNGLWYSTELSFTVVR